MAGGGFEVSKNNAMMVSAYFENSFLPRDIPEWRSAAAGTLDLSHLTFDEQNEIRRNSKHLHPIPEEGNGSDEGSTPGATASNIDKDIDTEKAESTPDISLQPQGVNSYLFFPT